MRKNPKTNEGIYLTGHQQDWDRLPPRIRTLIKNESMPRLYEIRRV